MVATVWISSIHAQVRHFWCLASKDTRMTIKKQMITYVYIFILLTVTELWLTNFWKCPGRPETKPRLSNKQTWGRDSQLCWICPHRQVYRDTLAHFPLFSEVITWWTPIFLSVKRMPVSWERLRALPLQCAIVVGREISSPSAVNSSNKSDWILFPFWPDVTKEVCTH